MQWKPFIIVLVIICLLSSVLIFEKDSFFLFSNISVQNREGIISIGVIAPFSGNYSIRGENDLRGMDFAIEDLNKRGINNISVIPEDSAGDPAKAVAAANKLISVNKVDLIYTNLSGVGIAVAPVAASAGKLFIYEAASTVPAKSHPGNTIKIGYYIYETHCGDFKKVIEKENFSKIAMVLAQKDFSYECKKGFLEDNNSIVFDEFFFIPSSEDFSTILSKVANNYDAILVTGYNPDFEKLYKKLLEKGLNIPVMCAGAEDCLVEDIEIAPSKLFLFGAEINDEFKKKMLQRFPESSVLDISIAAEAYDMVMFVSDAFSKCPSKDVNCMFDAVIHSEINSVVSNNGFSNNLLQWKTEIYTLGSGKEVVVYGG